MKYSFAVAAGLAAFASAVPVSTVEQAQPPNGFGADFSFPLANGFPNPSANAIKSIEKQAGGTLPNGAAPPAPGADLLADFQVIAANEIFEVAYFTELLHNVSNNVAGYKVAESSYDYVVKSLSAIKAQEELHALSANSVLTSFGKDAIEPCKYTFPVTNYADAIALAATFTDLVLGALQGVEADAAAATNGPIAQIIGSIIGQEGEQVGYYRYAQGKVPSSAPFLTNTNGIFAYNALMQLFIVPGSCPQTLDIPTLGALSVTNMPKASNGTAKFEAAGSVTSDYYLTYISGQDVPVTVPISDIKTTSDATTFSAPFPFGEGFSKGLTLAAVTKSAGPFANSTEVAMNSAFGPGLIEVD